MEYGFNLFSPNHEYSVIPGRNLNSDAAFMLKQSTILLLYYDPLAKLLVQQLQQNRADSV